MVVEQIAAFAHWEFKFKGFPFFAFPFPNLRSAGKKIARKALVAAFADRCADFLLRTTATKTHPNTLVRSHLRNQAIESANARDVLAVNTQDDVVFAQARFLGWAVWDELRDADGG